jgi:AraC-like DNA-binding protein
MTANFRYKLSKKRRKYPIKRDESGKSARCRAFDAFDRGLRPAQVIREVGISLRTACRYFADWKKHRPRLEPRYRFAKRLLKNHPEFSEGTITMIGEALGMRKWSGASRSRGESSSYPRASGRIVSEKPDRARPVSTACCARDCAL